MARSGGGRIRRSDGARSKAPGTSRSSVLSTRPTRAWCSKPPRCLRCLRSAARSSTLCSNPTGGLWRSSALGSGERSCWSRSAISACRVWRRPSHALFPNPGRLVSGDPAARNFESVLDAKPCPRGDGDTAIEALTSRLSSAAPLEHKPRVLILRHAMVNAFALPGNRIVITTGMIVYLETSGELAGILAQEMGNLQHRDVITLLIDQAGWDALEAAIFGLKATGQFGRTLLSLSY